VRKEINEGPRVPGFKGASCQLLAISCYLLVIGQIVESLNGQILITLFNKSTNFLFNQLTNFPFDYLTALPSHLLIILSSQLLFSFRLTPPALRHGLESLNPRPLEPLNPNTCRPANRTTSTECHRCRPEGLSLFSVPDLPGWSFQGVTAVGCLPPPLWCHSSGPAPYALRHAPRAMCLSY
jgi:hypothetical protein